MAGEKSSGGKHSTGPLEASDEISFNINPQPPSKTTSLFNPNTWDGNATRHVGFVIDESKPNLRPSWSKILSPTLSTTFYSLGKAHNLPLHSMVSCYQTQPSFVDRQMRLMVNNVSPLSRADVAADNRGAFGSRAQSWAKGVIKTNSFGKEPYAMEVTSSRGPRKGRLLPFDPHSLHPGSRVLPPDTPALFQTSYTKGQNSYSNKPEIMSVTYDCSEYAKHAGLMPSSTMLDGLEKVIGAGHLVFGLSSIIDPRGVSIKDLIEVDNAPLDRTNMASLVKRGLEVLKKRKLLLEKVQADKDDPSLTQQLFTLNRSLKPSCSLVVFIIPNFLKRKAWIDMTNRHFAHNQVSEVAIQKVRILEMAEGSCNKDNVARVKGLLARHVDEWRVPDFQEAHQLFSGIGPFTELVPQEDSEPELHLPEPDTYLTRDTNHHHTNQLLVISLSLSSRSLAQVPSSEVNQDKSSRPKLGTERLGSLLLSFHKSRAEEAEKTLGKFMPQMNPGAVEEVACADARLTALRITMDMKEDYKADVIEYLNDAGLNQLFRAGDWDALHQDKDDAHTRTILFRSSHNPQHDTMLALDPNIQYHTTTHGIMRIKSHLSTIKLITQASQINKQFKKVEGQEGKQVDKRGERAIFQAILDNEGLHWIGLPASAPSRRGANPWAALSPVALTRHFPGSVSSHRIIIKGLAPSWTPGMLKKALGDFKISEAAQKEAQWAVRLDTGVGGAMGLHVVIAHDSVQDLEGSSMVYDRFILTELSILGGEAQVQLRGPLFAKEFERNAHDVKARLQEAIKGGFLSPAPAPSQVVLAMRQAGDKTSEISSMPPPRTRAPPNSLASAVPFFFKSRILLPVTRLSPRNFPA